MAVTDRMIGLEVYEDPIGFRAQNHRSCSKGNNIIKLQFITPTTTHKASQICKNMSCNKHMVTCEARRVTRVDQGY